MRGGRDESQVSNIGIICPYIHCFNNYLLPNMCQALVYMLETQQRTNYKRIQLTKLRGQKNSKQMNKYY